MTSREWYLHVTLEYLDQIAIISQPISIKLALTCTFCVKQWVGWGGGLSVGMILVTFKYMY